MTYRLCSASFACWKTQLLQQRWEKRKTVQALWHWSLSLQRKIFDAWLRFAKGQQEKKDCVAKATGVYHATVPREGVTRVLRYTTGMKQLGRRLQVQHQLKKQVTFQTPDVSPATGGHSAEEEPWPSECCHLPFHLADGGSILRDLSEAPFQQTSVNKSSAQTGNVAQTPQMEESTRERLSQMGNPAHSYPSPSHAALPSVPLRTPDTRRAVQRPELWSPSSFMPQMRAGAEMRGSQPASGRKGAHSQDSQQDSLEKSRPNLQPCLLSPGGLVGKRSHQTAAEREEREHSSREEMVLQRKLEVELQHIQQQMQYYFSRKQELKSCQQQAQILQKWLEMSVQPGDQDGVQEVQEELGQLQVRINTLTKAQLKERHHVQNLVARLRDIQIALDI